MKFKIVPQGAHQEIAPPPDLRARAVTTVTWGDDSWDLSALQRAEEAVRELSKEFDGWMDAEIERLAAVHEAFRAAPEDAAARGELFRVTHDIRGQAETLGFPLAGRIADGLCGFMEANPELDAGCIVLVSAHVNAIRAIVRENVRTVDDPTAAAIARGLGLARDRIQAADSA